MRTPITLAHSQAVPTLALFVIITLLMVGSVFTLSGAPVPLPNL